MRKNEIWTIIIGILFIWCIVLMCIIGIWSKQDNHEQSFDITESDFYKKYANTSWKDIDWDTGYTYTGENYYQKYLHYNEWKRLFEKESVHIKLSNWQMVERELE